jgi:hypothetical protein
MVSLYVRKLVVACRCESGPVTDNRRAEDPRPAGTAWVAVRNRDVAAPVTEDVGLGVLPGLLARALTGVAAIWLAVGRREHRRLAVACATGRFPAQRRGAGGPEHRGQSSCGRLMLMLMPDFRDSRVTEQENTRKCLSYR